LQSTSCTELRVLNTSVIKDSMPHPLDSACHSQWKKPVAASCAERIVELNQRKRSALVYIS